MSKRCGKLFRVSLSADGLTWYTLATRADSCAFSAGLVDVTDKDDQPWRTSLAGCGILGLVVNSSGVFGGSADALAAWELGRAAWFARSLVHFRIVSGGFEIVAEGLGRVLTLERAGEYEGAETFTLSLECSGAPGSYTVPPIPDPPPIVTNEFAVALSGRKVVPAYAGACMRVRRSSDNAEQDIGFASNGLLDTAALLSFVGSGNGYVVRWFNQYTGWPLQYVEQTSLTNQPRIVNAGVVDNLNGIPAPRFDGSTSFLVTPAVNQMPGWGNVPRGSSAVAMKCDTGNSAVFSTNDTNFGGYITANLTYGNGLENSLAYRWNDSVYFSLLLTAVGKTRAIAHRCAGSYSPGVISYDTRGNNSATFDRSGTMSLQSNIPGRLTNFWFVGRSIFGGSFFLGNIGEIIASSLDWGLDTMHAVNAEQTTAYGVVYP